MFRVKLSVPPERVLPYIERVKTGIRGVGYVRLDDAVDVAGVSGPAIAPARPRRGGRDLICGRMARSSRGPRPPRRSLPASAPPAEKAVAAPTAGEPAPKS